jgi:hypothetical protein
MVIASLSAVLVQPAAARPRSWFLPPLTVSCQVGEGKTETFNGAYELSGAAAVKGVLMVGGTLVGTCGPASIDTMFRTTISVTDADCDEATLTLGDALIKDALVNFSEEPIVVTTDDVKRGTLCSLARAQNGSLRAQANALNRLFAQQA